MAAWKCRSGSSCQATTYSAWPCLIRSSSGLPARCPWHVCTFAGYTLHVYNTQMYFLKLHINDLETPFEGLYLLDAGDAGEPPCSRAAGLFAKQVVDCPQADKIQMVLLPLEEA